MLSADSPGRRMWSYHLFLVPMNEELNFSAGRMLEIFLDPSLVA